MDALILSCGTGGGHNAAGTAIKNELMQRGHHVEMLNPYTLKGGRLAAIIDGVYIGLVQKAPAVFGIIYKLGNLYRRLPIHSPVYYLNNRMISDVEELLEQHHYDVIIMPHLFPAEIITNIKQRGYTIPLTFFIATDYTCIPFTEETECDYYIIPSEELRSEFSEKGICQEKIYPHGIPVGTSFLSHQSRVEARKLLGFDYDKRYILVLGGSIGAGKLPKVIQILLKKYEGKNTKIVVICGSNDKLYERLKLRYKQRLVLLGYTEQIAEYMKACDLIISKPGGLSSTEAAAMGTALIHITPIPGCESRNMHFFAKHGMSIAISSLKKQLIPACEKLLEEVNRKKMIKKQKIFINANASADICNMIEQFIDQENLIKSKK